MNFSINGGQTTHCHHVHHNVTCLHCYRYNPLPSLKRQLEETEARLELYRDLDEVVRKVLLTEEIPGRARIMLEGVLRGITNV